MKEEKTPRISEHLQKPLYLCWESELEHYLKVYTRKGATNLCAQIEAELQVRRKETEKIQAKYKPKPVMVRGVKPQAYSDHEKETIFKLYKEKTDLEISEILGIARSRVYSFRAKRGLHKYWE